MQAPVDDLQEHLDTLYHQLCQRFDMLYLSHSESQDTCRSLDFNSRKALKNVDRLEHHLSCLQQIHQSNCFDFCDLRNMIDCCDQTSLQAAQKLRFCSAPSPLFDIYLLSTKARFERKISLLICRLEFLHYIVNRISRRKPPRVMYTSAKPLLAKLEELETTIKEQLYPKVEKIRNMLAIERSSRSLHPLLLSYTPGILIDDPLDRRRHIVLHFSKGAQRTFLSLPA